MHSSISLPIQMLHRRYFPSRNGRLTPKWSWMAFDKKHIRPPFSWHWTVGFNAMSYGNVCVFGSNGKHRTSEWAFTIASIYVLSSAPSRHDVRARTLLPVTGIFARSRFQAWSTNPTCSKLNRRIHIFELSILTVVVVSSLVRSLPLSLQSRYP